MSDLFGYHKVIDAVCTLGEVKKHTLSLLKYSIIGGYRCAQGKDHLHANVAMVIRSTVIPGASIASIDL